MKWVMMLGACPAGRALSRTRQEEERFYGLDATRIAFCAAFTCTATPTLPASRFAGATG